MTTKKIPSQNDKFKATARMLHIDISEKTFGDALRRIAKAPAPAKPQKAKKLSK